MSLFHPPHTLRLDSGAELAFVTVGYETWGRLNAEGSNCILIAHALTGDAHVAHHPPEDCGAEDPRAGWWEGLVGPGAAIDTRRHFVVCSNVLGGCRGSTGPLSLNPATGRPYGPDFPDISIRDMVRVQRHLLAALGVRRVAAVIGGSMGGMQALEWALMYPGLVEQVVAIGAPGRSYPQAVAYNEVMRLAIQTDPEWRGGHYAPGAGPAGGLALARMLGMITYQNDLSMRRKFFRENAADSARNVIDYLHYQGRKLVQRFDANTYVVLTRAMDRYDLGSGRGGWERAFRELAAGRSSEEPASTPGWASRPGASQEPAGAPGPRSETAPTPPQIHLVGIRTDILYPPYQVRELATALQRAGVPAYYHELDSSVGHDGFLVDSGKMAAILSQVLHKEAE
ncbi:MAG: homoserine O-acetyltransferase [Firmicutes bacterium]|nr:homoserine O-acetyltransferase [Bacillota bacterium]